jgi:predicted permease
MTTNAFDLSVRRLRRSPGFTVASVLSLAIGIGTTTAMFTLLETLKLRQLPVHAPDRLVRVNGLDPNGQIVGLTAAMRDLLNREQLVDGLCGFLTSSPTVKLRDEVLAGSTLAVTGGCLSALGVRPALGRLLEPADDAVGAPAVAVLTYDAWQTHWKNDHGVIGQEISIDGRPAAIVGVLQRGFNGPLLGFPSRVIYPLSAVAPLMDTFSPQWSASRPTDTLARLRSGDSADALKARLRSMWPRLLEASQPMDVKASDRNSYLSQGLSLEVGSTGIDYMLRERFERPLIALASVAFLVLLISCVNVANLQVARSVALRRELAVQMALGASRRRLLTDAMAECLLLLLASIVVGMAVAYIGDRMLVTSFGARYAGFQLDVAPNTHTLWFTAATGIASFLAIAVGPAWSLIHIDSSTLGASLSRVRRRGLLRSVLVVAQISATLGLVTGALLLVGTLQRLRDVRIGFDADSVISMYLRPLPGGYQNGFSSAGYYRDLLDRVGRVPGVRDVSLAQLRPLSDSSRLISVGTNQSLKAEVTAERAIVADGFLELMGISLASGDDLRSVANVGDQVAVISQSLGIKLFGDHGSPVGEIIRVGRDQDARPLRVVGIANDAILTNPQAQNTLVVYESFWSLPESLQRQPTLLVRPEGNATSVANSVRILLQESGREYFQRARTAREEQNNSLAQERLLAGLSAAWAVIGLVLAAIGIYGLLSFIVAGRTREIGIRMALGAGRAHVTLEVVRQAGLLAIAGALLGLPMSIAIAAVVRTILPSVGSFDARVFAASVAMLLLVGSLAAWSPARRATSVAPSDILRHE